jgi:hypothetical protein
VCSAALIHSLPIPSVDVKFFPADARELYCHAEEPIFLFLIFGGESILMHYDDRGIRCAACPRKVWEYLLDGGDEVGFLACEVVWLTLMGGF